MQQPGETITPGAQHSRSDKSEQLHESENGDEAARKVGSSAQGEEATQEAEWQFADDGSDVVDPLVPIDESAVTWTASEYVAHDKSAGWYLLVVLGAALLGGLIYVISRDLVSPIVVVVLGVAFAAFGARKPQVLDYAIDNSGVHIGQRLYPYGIFKTFSVLEEDATRSILLMPLQRFNLPISIYYDPSDEERIIGALAVHLPHEDRQPGMIDNFMRKIRF